MKTFILILTFVFGCPLFASSAGTILMTNGQVEVFVNPSRNARGPKPRVLFNSWYYTVKKARVGQRIKWNQVIKTSPSSKAKVGFKNGDTVSVGPGTAYSFVQNKVKSKGSKKKKGSLLNLMYGKVRAVVSKNGPRNNLKVKTPTSVAGVRGTDFYISHSPSKIQTELSVIRGAVEVKEKKSAAPPIQVKSGFTAKVNQKPALPKKGEVTSGAETVDIKKTSKQKLARIHSVSKVVVVKEKLEELPEAIKEEIQVIEKKNVEVILDDIKAEDPVQFEALKKKENLKAEDLNKAAVVKLIKQAPSDPKEEKVTEEELNNLLNEDIYKSFE